MPAIRLTRRSFMGLCLAALGAGPLRAGTREEAFAQDVADAIGAAVRRGANTQAYARIFTRYADVQDLSLAALGPWRARLPSNLRAAYFDAVTRYVARAAAQNARGFGDGELRVTGSSAGSVTGVLRGGGRSQRVAFRLSNRSGNLRVRDVSVDGVWVGLQLREAVTGRLNRTRGDYRDLITFLSTGSNFAREK